MKNYENQPGSIRDRQLLLYIDCCSSATPSSFRLIDCPTQPICTWIFICAPWQSWKNTAGKSATSRWEPQHGCSTSSLSQISRRCRRKKLDNIYTWRFFLLFLNSVFDSIFWQTETINTLRCHNCSLWALRTSRYHRLQRRQSRSPW